ncbi:DUF58 domain-containing protein [Microbacterium sp. cf332]|uniref:DUF58 domain-containing protein n=1 Tax=Microbacterium sp. cf332 TaxID=1761804 RepID=UPI00088A4F05|nr:DUF58 domain-containing protein [Microbacterium sp. cf332]SDQ22183.1 Uncharacterized conserved protein, DUF58 family, contains vWF domain [Microbacterium sp. cf332]
MAGSPAPPPPARALGALARAWPLTLRGTGAVVIGVASIVCAHAFGVAELLYVGVLLLASVVLAWVSLWFVHRYGDVSRSFAPDVAAVGRGSVVTVHATARGGLSGAIARWADRLPEGIEGDATGILAGANALDHVRLTYHLRATRRGIRDIGPFSMLVTDPFGFTRRRLSLGGVESVTVTPAVVALPPLMEYPGEAGGSLHTATHQLGEGADNLIPRAYAPGDSMRRINWRASAHHDELMVRQEEQESTPEATVVLDRATRRWPAAAARTGADPAFETAVTAAVSAVARLSREGYDVTVIDTDGRPIGSPVAAGDAVAVEQLALDLATVVSGGDDRLAGLARLFAGTVAGPVVVVTAQLTGADADALAPIVAHSALPVLLASDSSDAVLARATDAGWRAAGLAPDGDLAEAWRVATERGSARAAF